MEEGMINPHRAIGALFVFSLMGCTTNETQINALTAEIFVAPGEADFGEAVEFQTRIFELQVSNVGAADLEITDINFDDSEGIGQTGIFTSARAISAEQPLSLEPDDSATLIIEFNPQEQISYDASMVITSNAGDDPEFLVPVSGIGIATPLCTLSAVPDTIDFGDVTAIDQKNDGEREIIQLFNTGDAQCVIESALFEGSGAFRVTADTDPTGQIVNAQDSLPIQITYEPTIELGDSATLTIASDDPNSPLEIDLLGNGGATFEYPVAVIDGCPESVSLPYDLLLDGAASFDPEGNEPLTYLWEVIAQPEGSSAAFLAPDAVIGEIPINVIGDWRVGLSVTNSEGIPSARTQCTFEALPSDLVEIEITWDKDGTDVDLHLIQNDGEFYSVPDDCTNCNPTPDWGVIGESMDDPTLTVDDRDGLGPERINIPSEPADGDYRIIAHYFESDGLGDTVVNMNLYIGGELRFRKSRQLSRNDAWDIGVLRWEGDQGAFIETPNNAAIFIPERRRCDDGASTK